MEIINTFKFHNTELQVFGSPNEPYFKAKTVAQMLGYSDTKQAIQNNIDREDKRTAEDMGGKFTPHKDTIFINESGLYSLVFGSKKPIAKKFTRWVTKEVLPSIRRTGSYTYTPSVHKHNEQLTIQNETDLHTAIITYIKDFNEKKKKKIMYNVSLGEMQRTQDQRIDAYKKGYQKGSPDILILNKTHKYDGLAIELKTPKGNGNLSEAQKYMLNEYNEAKYKVLVSNSYAEVITSIFSYMQNTRIPCALCNHRFRSLKSLKNHKRYFHKITCGFEMI